ncbi:hypothetical protein [Neptuniibacter marinus]|uniref:hypothetical protein n=1 Tax=Neptuniibacter marinus TaxID=1806670 RepID=UPI003B598622
MSEVLVTFQDLRKLKYCAPRVRVWCDDHGIDIRRFRAGIPASELRATGCGLAIKAAELAEREAVE